ncbi:hypothetical protein XELAEV_18031846mg [Xenopus laevis]|uniref:Uncharacterized protein n=1 Tax=Xenopus laevis TaxID=8355 RepID=A0A974CNS9_XENLA|nr:hypothetical protein XELAEV_18031846mg [Xenopus laevis]
MRQLTKDVVHKPVTIAQIQTEFPSIRHNIFAFLQAQMYTSRTIRLLDKDWDNSLDRFLLRTESTRGAVSQNYRFLQDNIDYDSLPTGPKQWTVDMPELGMEDIFKMRESSDCAKNGQTRADLIYCLWACPFIRRFWNQIRDYAIRHLVNYIPLSAAWALWGISPNIHTRITWGAKRLLLIITAVAKKTILQRRKPCRGDPSILM